LSLTPLLLNNVYIVAQAGPESKQHAPSRPRFTATERRAPRTAAREQIGMHREAILDVADVCDVDRDALPIDQNEAAVGGRFAEANSEQFRGFHVGDANRQRLVGVRDLDVAHLDDFGQSRRTGEALGAAVVDPPVEMKIDDRERLSAVVLDAA